MFYQGNGSNATAVAVEYRNRYNNADAVLDGPMLVFDDYGEAMVVEPSHKPERRSRSNQKRRNNKAYPRRPGRPRLD